MLFYFSVGPSLALVCQVIEMGNLIATTDEM